MAKYSINTMTEADLPTNTLKQCYISCKSEIASKNGCYPNFNFTDLDYIFEVACNNRKLFTEINAGKNPTYQTYINHWILTYCKASRNLPSQKKAKAKSTCNDPIIQTMVKKVCDISDSQVAEQVNIHNIFM